MTDQRFLPSSCISYFVQLTVGKKYEFNWKIGGSMIIGPFDEIQ